MGVQIGSTSVQDNSAIFIGFLSTDIERISISCIIREKAKWCYILCVLWEENQISIYAVIAQTSSGKIHKRLFIVLAFAWGRTELENKIRKKIYFSLCVFLFLKLYSVQNCLDFKNNTKEQQTGKHLPHSMAKCLFP